MDEFISRFLIMIVAVVFLALVVGRILLLMRKAGKIDKEGIEANAVISWIDHEVDPDDGDEYCFYASYEDEMGVERESAAGNFSFAEYEVGQKVRIKYIPGEYDEVRIVS